MPKISLLAQKLWPAALLTHTHTDTHTDRQRKQRRKEPIRRDQLGRLSLDTRSNITAQNMYICFSVY